MERGLTHAVVAAAAASKPTVTPLYFSNHSFIHRLQFSLPTTTTPSAADGNTISTNKGRKAICVKALKSSGAARQSLSSNWNVAGSSSLVVAAPTVIPRLEELDFTNMMLRQRCIVLSSRVDDAIADFIINQLLLLDAEDPNQDIKLFINSSGGSLTAAMGIYDAMKLCKADVSTICIGMAASSAAFLLAAGTKGKRFCMPNSTVLMRQPYGIAGGAALDAVIRVREMMYQKTKRDKILSRITGKSLEQVKKDFMWDHYMNAWEAKEYGLVDAVIDDGKPGLVAPVADATPPPRPIPWGYLGLKHSRGTDKKKMSADDKTLQNGHDEGQENDETTETGQQKKEVTYS